MAFRKGRKKAAREWKATYLGHSDTYRPPRTTPILRSDHGLIFQHRRFGRTCRDYRLRQELVTPYTLEQNSLNERSLRN
ncbi:MAG: hypothetical protein R3B83_12975 [Nitrospirales bacterium]|nr:hypothetical protein [Nitrospirales bacterium]